MAVQRMSPEPRQEGREPFYEASSYDCPHCGAYSQMTWSEIFNPRMSPDEEGHLEDLLTRPAATCRVALCNTCDRQNVWVCDSTSPVVYSTASSFALVWPSVQALGPSPSADLPGALRADFEEARQTIAVSPRGGCALARLVIEKLLGDELGAAGSTINEMIGDLVQKGQASPEVQQALDGIRYLGNEAVHDGELDLSGDKDTAVTLLMLVNMIVQRAITEPRQAQAVFDRIPQNKKDGITQRDQPRS